MCRHLAYAGPAIDVAGPLLDAPHALVTQVDRPLLQGDDAVNLDGWGCAWWDGAAWQRHRSTVRFDADTAGQELVRGVRSTAFIAAVRRASPWSAHTETGNAPFLQEGWAFSLNGFVGAFDREAGRVLRAALSERRRSRLDGDTDSEVLFGLVLDRIDAGSDPAGALAGVTDHAVAAAGSATSRLNLLLTDGGRIWASRSGNSLFARDGAIASEPWDDDPAWREVEDRA